MNEEDFKKIQAYFNQLRRFQGIRSTTKYHKDLDELDDVQTALTAAGLQFTDLKHRGNQDPPDCEAIIDGIRCGIEVTELMHRPSLEKSLKFKKTGEGSLQYHDWSREGFLKLLGERIQAKDNPTNLKDGPYKRYFLVIWTGEMYLDGGAIESFLEGVSFQCSLITDAYVTLPYRPRSESLYPTIRLNITKEQTGA